MKKVITRFAPSPTGMLHIGGVRTALYAYAMARKHNGKFILRIEDTDQTRKVDGSVEEITDMLAAYKLDFDEMHIQSDRKDIYREYAEKLIEKGSAFYCFTTKEELDEARERAQSNGEQFKFRSPYRDLSLVEAKKMIDEGKQYVVRLKTPLDQEVYFEDPLQGKMIFHTREVDDTVLLKSDGFPTYHLAVVVDDHLMEVSHAFRGVEWIPSTPKHVLLYEAFGWEMPIIVHLPVILDPDGGKLSKRKGTVSARAFLEEGYTIDALLNFLMLIGWSAPIAREHGEKEREFFSLEEFVDLFSIERLTKSSGIFNRDKLIWFNQQYIKNYSPDKLENLFLEWLKINNDNAELQQRIISKGPDYLQKILVLVRDRAKLLAELVNEIETFYFEPAKQDFGEYKQTKGITREEIVEILSRVHSKLEIEESVEAWGHEAWESFMRGVAEELGLGAGKVFMTLRIAVTGSNMSPPLFEYMEIIEKDKVLARIEQYVTN